MNFCGYWGHRLFHTRVGWIFHRFHHAADQLSPALSLRTHPFELAVGPIIRIWPLMFLELSPAVVTAFFTWEMIHGFLEHSELKWKWGFIGRWVLMPPIGHRIHHSPFPEHRDKNFGGLVIWDRLFGTWYSGETVNEVIGLAANSESSHVVMN
jgi:sterol desaturase/sphingolipid hydroxylase (fatty acid hydroxylase superfamily)